MSDRASPIGFFKSMGAADWIIVVLAVACIAVNIFRLPYNNFWGDECYTIIVGKMSFEGLWKAQSTDVHPPLYHVIEKVFADIFGQEPWVYNFVTFVPFVALVGVVATSVRKRYGSITALTMMVCIALFPVALEYESEVRMYEWGMLFILLTILRADSFMKDPSNRNAVLLVICSLLSAYTHMYCLLGVATIYLTVLWRFYKHKSPAVKKTIYCIIASSIGYLPWLMNMFMAVRDVSQDFWIEASPNPYDMVAFVMGFRPNAIPVTIVPALVAIAIISIVLYNYTHDESRFCEYTVPKTDESGRFYDLLTVCLLVLIVPVFVAYIVGFVRPVLVYRYAYPLAIGLWLAFGLCLERYRERAKVALIALGIVALCAVPGSAVYLVNEYNETQLTDKFLDETAVITSDDYIITNINHLDWTVLDYYYPGVGHAKIVDDMIPEMRDGCQNWLFLDREISQEYVDEFLSRNYNCVLTVEDGQLSIYTTWVYKLVHV